MGLNSCSSVVSSTQDVTRRGELILRAGLVVIEYCRAEDYLSNDTKYVRLR